MDNTQLLENIRSQRNFQSMIKNLAIVAAKVFQIEDDVAEIKRHLGIEAKADEEK